MDTSTTLGGVRLKNPLMPGSGPLTGDGDRMVQIAGMGVGALVTKTIAPEGARVGRACIVGADNIIMNSEAWSEYPAKTWMETFLPLTVAQTDTPLVISIGYTEEDMKTLIPSLEPFASVYEIIPRYVGKDLDTVGKIVRRARSLTDKPLYVKMNANLPDPVAFARVCWDGGAQGVVAITSLGPNMVVDLANRRPLIGTEQGYVWSSGPVIKPLALATVHMIKQEIPDISIIGCGGIASAEDVLEFLLVGADAVQMLSEAMLNGKATYRKILKDLPDTLSQYGFNSVREVIGSSLQPSRINYEPSYPQINHETCNKCNICVKNCPYFAMKWVEKKVYVDREKCFGCGLCESRCPVDAISGVLA